MQGKICDVHIPYLLSIFLTAIRLYQKQVWFCSFVSPPKKERNAYIKSIRCFELIMFFNLI